MRGLTIGSAGLPVAGAIRYALPLGALGGKGGDRGGGFVLPPFRVEDGTLRQPVIRPKVGRAGRAEPVQGRVMRLHAPINAWFRGTIL